MFSLSINMKFWDDGHPDSTRIRNVNFTWDRIKGFTKFLKKNGINVVCTLYDFSPEKIITESTHIPYPLGVYKKSEKTNIILNHQKNYDFFMMVDCDAFIDKSDYDTFLKHFLNIKKGDILTFDLSKLDDNIHDYIIDGEFYSEKSTWSYAYSSNKDEGPLSNGRKGGLGGVYICDTNLLLSLNGFDETYVGWGGEDGDMLERIINSGLVYEIKPIRDFSPYHLPHFSDWNNNLYKKRFINE